MRSARGQATIEYVAIVAVLALLLSTALALGAPGGPGIVNAVAAQLRHALCLVGGAGPCPDLRSRPCTVASTRDTRHVAVSLVLVRVDHDRYVLREDMSDGTVRLTVARSGAGGVELGIGARAHATVKGRTVGWQNEARGGGQLALGSGRVYVARDAREAAAFMRAIRAGDDPPARAREVFVEGGARGLATVGAGGPVVGGSLRGLAGVTIGARRDERTRDVTLALGAGASGWGALTVAFGGPVATSDRSLSIGLTLDRRRRPKEVSLAASLTLAAGAALPPGFARALGGASLLSADTGGRRLELGARLDLRDPAAAAAWRAFRDDPASGAAIRALGHALRDRAHLDVRVYHTEASSSGGGAGVGEVVQVGGEFDHTIERSRLVAARSRPSGGLWEQRLDCLRA